MKIRNRRRRTSTKIRALIPIDGMMHATSGRYDLHTVCGIYIAGRIAGEIPSASACVECAVAS